MNVSVFCILSGISIGYILSSAFVFGMLQAIMPNKHGDDFWHLIISLLWPIVIPVIILFVSLKRFVVVPIASSSEKLAKNWMSKSKPIKDTCTELPEARIHRDV